MEKKIEIIRFFPEMSVFVVILVILGLPWYIPFIFGCIVLLFLLLSVIEFKRLQNVNINISMLDERTVQHTIHTNENESISGAVYGILKGAASFRDIFKPTGVAILGSGKSYYPENTLLLTNVRLLFVYVPVTGGNTIIGPTNYVSQNFFFNRGEIRQKGEAMVKNTPLPEIVKFAIDDIYYADIRKCTLKKMKLTVETNDGKKVSYTFLDNEYIAVLQPLLQHYLGERAICKN